MIQGPYEVDPENPLLTSAGKPHIELQKAGHASLVETQTHEWYLVHLCGRLVGEHRRCMLGRETAIQKVQWTDDGWLRVWGGGNDPKVEVLAPELPEHGFGPEPARDDFDLPELGVHFSTLRVPTDRSWLSLAERPGHLRLYGRESLASKHRQSLVARRLQAFKVKAETCVEFAPDHFQQMAGLICIYDTQNYFYLHVSRDAGLGQCLRVAACDNNAYDEPLEQAVSIAGWTRCYMRVNVDHAALWFSCSRDGETWATIGPTFDATQLSDEYCQEGHFTGAFVGMCCQDLSGARRHADFGYFEYHEEV